MSYSKTDSFIKSGIHTLFISVLFILIFAATASAREVTLSWDANSEPDLDHYVVYWGVIPGDYSNNSGDIGLATDFSVELPDDSQVYFFAVTAVDEAGLESDYSNEVSTDGTSTGDTPTIHVLPINSNWNLISISSGSGATSIEDALASILDDVISVWAYVNGEWLVYNPANPDDSDLLEVEPGQGLWVNMSVDSELTIPGETPADGIDLSGGWNLIGFSSPNSLDIADAISSIEGNVVSVWAYKNGQWLVYDPQNPDFSDLATMDPGYGYWIKMRSSSVWTY